MVAALAATTLAPWWELRAIGLRRGECRPASDTAASTAAPRRRHVDRFAAQRKWCCEWCAVPTRTVVGQGSRAQHLRTHYLVS